MSQKTAPGGLSRRDLLRTGATTAAVAGLARSSPSVGAVGRSSPNILLILTDQQSGRAVGAHGNSQIRTPYLDGLIASGTSFTESYCADPTCCSARAAILTGRPSCESGVLINPMHLRTEIPDLGAWLESQSSYDTYYIGKWHLPGRDSWRSFRMINPSSINGECSDLSQVRSFEGLLQNLDGANPWFTVVSLLNPHDIAQWVWMEWQGAHADALGLTEAELPPLPPNFDLRHEEAALFQAIKRNTTAETTWQREKWQMYRWWYNRQVENVDASIGRLVDLVRNSRFASDTLILMTADHGDMVGEMKLVNKQSFYEASARVPFVASWPGVLPARGVDRRHLVSGLDVVPTVCDFAGIAPPPFQRGRSLRPLLDGSATEWREFLQIQSNVEGRAIRSDGYKYVTYRDDPVEQLFDVRRDPYELSNLASDPAFQSILQEHRDRQAAFEAELSPTYLSRAGYDTTTAARDARKYSDEAWLGG